MLWDFDLMIAFQQPVGFWVLLDFMKSSLLQTTVDTDLSVQMFVALQLVWECCILGILLEWLYFWLVFKNFSSYFLGKWRKLYTWRITRIKAAKLELLWSGMWHYIKCAYGDVLLFIIHFLRKKVNWTQLGSYFLNRNIIARLYN